MDCTSSVGGPAFFPFEVDPTTSLDFITDFDVEVFLPSSDGAVAAALPFEAVFFFLGRGIRACLPSEVASLSNCDAISQAEE